MNEFPICINDNEVVFVSKNNILVSEVLNRSRTLGIDSDLIKVLPYFRFKVLVIDETDFSEEEVISCLEKNKNLPVVLYTTSMGKGISPTELDKLHPCAHKCLNIGKLVAIIAFSCW